MNKSCVDDERTLRFVVVDVFFFFFFCGGEGMAFFTEMGREEALADFEVRKEI